MHKGSQLVISITDIRELFKQLLKLRPHACPFTCSHVSAFYSIHQFKTQGRAFRQGGFNAEQEIAK